MLDRPAHNFALYQDKPIEDGVAEICAPYIEALSERAKSESRPAPLDVPRPARIVPIDPKLHELDADAATMENEYESVREAYKDGKRFDNSAGAGTAHEAPAAAKPEAVPNLFDLLM